jgi:hypothetical protein
MVQLCLAKAFSGPGVEKMARSMSVLRAKANRLRRAGVRSAAALSLVEILVALVVGSLLAFAMADLFAGVRRLANTSQGEMYANLMAQELTENARACQYSFLNQYVGQQFNLMVNRDSLSQPSTPLRDDPLQLDLANLSWSDTTVSSKFTGTVNYRVDQAPGLTNGLLLTYTISWTDSSHAAANGGNLGRTITSSVLILKDGVNAWNP